MKLSDLPLGLRAITAALALAGAVDAVQAQTASRTDTGPAAIPRRPEKQRHRRHRIIGMANHRAWCALVGGAALFAAAWLPVDLQGGASHSRVVHPSMHAPMVRAVGPGGAPLAGPQNQSVSNNWSGYAVSGGAYTSAQGSWTVPAVSYAGYAGSPNFESSSAWVGIGGFSDASLIQ